MSDISIVDSGRVRSLKDMSVYGQRHGSAGGAYSSTRRIPRPYPTQRFIWDKERDIARLPSVKVIGSHPTPAMRQLSPQISLDGSQFVSKRSRDDFTPRYPDLTEREFKTQPKPIRKTQYRPLRVPDWGPFRKWTEQKLGFMSGQQRYLENFPIACKIRSTINQAVTRVQARR